MSTGPCPITSSLNPHRSAGRYKYGISFAAPDQTLSHSWFKSQIPSSLLSRETFLTLISGRMASQRSVSPFFTPHFFLSSFWNVSLSWGVPPSESHQLPLQCESNSGDVLHVENELPYSPAVSHCTFTVHHFITIYSSISIWTFMFYCLCE